LDLYQIIIEQVTVVKTPFDECVAIAAMRAANELIEVFSCDF